MPASASVWWGAGIVNSLLGAWNAENTDMTAGRRFLVVVYRGGSTRYKKFLGRLSGEFLRLAFADALLLNFSSTARSDR